MTCEHQNATAIGGAEHVTFDGDEYRVEKMRCDDCDEPFTLVWEMVSQLDYVPPTAKQAVIDHRDRWTDTE